ncbi:hypothetical protein [Kaarinaea lacus]
MIKNNSTFVFLLLVLLFIGSCSNKQMYEALQIKQKNDCQKLPHSEYKECIERAEKPYEEYEEERQQSKKL